MDGSIDNSNEQQTTSGLRLKEAIEDFLILLDYLARRGDDVGHSTIDAVISAERADQSNGFDASKEAALWVALNQLSKAAAPATPETIRFSQRRAGEGPSEGANRKITHAVASKYRSVTFVFFVLFVILSAYWSAVTASLGTLTEATEKLESKTTTSIEKQNAAVDIASSMRALKVLSLGSTSFFDHSSSDNHSSDNSSLDKPETKTHIVQSTTSDRFIRNLMKGVVDAIYLFILPLVAGGLGAGVYVVRLISKEIEREAFSPKLTIRFDLRIYLGSIAGLIICRLFLTEASNFGNTLTPIGIAFIVGYSIEVFFSLLDRIVGAFSTETRR